MMPLELALAPRPGAAVAMTLPPPGDLTRLAAEPARLFVYGTMAFPEVQRVLLGRAPDSTAASVAGWRVATVPDQARAVMVSAEAITHGRLISDLSNAEWQLIDAFETVCELRLVSLADGRQAWSCVCSDRRQVPADDWDADEFERDSFVAYLKDCAKWRKEYQARAIGR
jgi:hypothetical protein